MEADQGNRRALIPQASGAASKKRNIRRNRVDQQPLADPLLPPQENVVTSCSRCAKDFVQKKAPNHDNVRGRVGRHMPRLYKHCEHCRETGKSRSRTWQKRIRETGGLCTRCGIELTSEDGVFRMCVKCRQSLRVRKLRLAKKGKCVQCGIQLTSEGTNSEVSDSESGSVKKRRCAPCNLRANPPRSSAGARPRPSPFIRDLYQ